MKGNPKRPEIKINWKSESSDLLNRFFSAPGCQGWSVGWLINWFARDLPGFSPENPQILGDQVQGKPGELVIFGVGKTLVSVTWGLKV